MSRLAGKVAIVTGAGSGMGREAASIFAREGASVLLVDRGHAAVHDAAREIGSGVAAFVADMADPSQVEASISHAETCFGGLDIALLNAGIGRANPLASHSLEEFDEVLAVNVRGVWVGDLVRSGYRHGLVDRLDACGHSRGTDGGTDDQASGAGTGRQVASTISLKYIEISFL